MQVSVETTGPIERKLTITVPASEMDQMISKRLSELSRSVKVPGFRPGKVPRKVVESRYGDQVLREAADELINTSYREALTSQEILPAGLLSIEPQQLARGQDLEYVAVLEVFPEIPETGLKGQSVERPLVEVTEEDIDRTLEDIRSRNTQYEATEEAARVGDRVLIDFEGFIDDEPFAGGAASDFPVVVGAGALLKEFDQQLEGVKKGEEKEFDVTFPEDYAGKDVAGKTAQFKITIKKVEQAHLPELNDELATQLGIEEGGIEKLREEVANSLQRELDLRRRGRLREQVMDLLYKNNDIPLPARMVEEELERAVAEVRQQLEAQGLPSKQNIERSHYESGARRRVALGLIVREIVAAHDIEVDKERVQSRIEEMAASYEQPAEYLQLYMSDRERSAQVEGLVLEEQVVDKLLEDAEISDKKMSFQEFMNPQTASAEAESEG
ncbi:MAG: trigger factor [Pseudomonadota bacterium]|nr:trigger factor [Pseudomonadota bacterium]